MQEEKIVIYSDKWNRKQADKTDCIKPPSATLNPNCFNPSSFRPTDKLTRPQTNCFHGNSTQVDLCSKDKTTDYSSNWPSYKFWPIPA